MQDVGSQEKFYRHVIKVDNIDKQQLSVLDVIDKLYELFPDKKSITPAELRVYIKSRHPSRDTAHLDAIIDSAMAQEIGPEITRSLIESFIERHYAAKAMAIGSPVVSNQKSGGWAVETAEILQEYHDLVALSDRPDQLQDCDMSFQDAMEYRATDSGIKWPLKILNTCIGGVAPSLGLVAARPDTGKTSFILNCLAYFAHQLKGTNNQILYLGNEEGIVGLKARCGVSLLGVDTEWAEANTRAFGQQVEAKNGNCIRFHGGITSTKDVETLIKRYNPIVTVADQIGKFKIPGSQVEGPAGLALVYQWFREIGNTYNTMVLGAAQIGASGANKQWPTMSDINASKTDVPGELDFMIAIGMLDETGMETVRFINVAKNKLKYGRKGRDQVSFSAETCRYKG